jgi:predicted RNA-binding protein with PUA-like domain
MSIKTTDSNYVYYDCRGASVEERGSIAWMPAYIAVPNLLSMISMRASQQFQEASIERSGNRIAI